MVLPDDLHLESLEVGAAPLIRHFLQRLNLHALFERHLPVLPGRPPALPSPTVLCLLVTNLLLARQPLYALPHWAARWVPEFLGLQPGQATLLNDDRLGRALDHLQRADRASLLTALVQQLVGAFAIDLSEFHQDTTTVTFSGDYGTQPDATCGDRPPRITFGYNKDHRPDLKQLLYSITISADGAVPLHCKLYDGNTTDDAVHIDTWLFLRQLVGHSDFLYVADSKLCSRDNMSFIDSRQGRFLTIMPRTRNEDNWFRNHVQTHDLEWREVHREPHRTRRRMNEQASAWLTAVEGLSVVHARLKRVVIVGPKDAKEVIQQQDGANTLFYLDPPYLDETRAAPKVYRVEMTRDQHTDLLDVVKAVKGKVMLSGYDSELYQQKLVDWNRHTFELPNNAASGESKRKMTEVVWVNF